MFSAFNDQMTQYGQFNSLESKALSKALALTCIAYIGFFPSKFVSMPQYYKNLKLSFFFGFQCAVNWRMELKASRMVASRNFIRMDDVEFIVEVLILRKLCWNDIHVESCPCSLFTVKSDPIKLLHIALRLLMMFASDTVTDIWVVWCWDAKHRTFLINYLRKHS